MNTALFLLLAVSLSLARALTTYQVQDENGQHVNLSLCNPEHYPKYVRRATGLESAKLQSVLGLSNNIARFELLNKMNVSRSVCSRLAVHMSAKKINRTDLELKNISITDLEESVLEDANLMQSLLATRDCESTVSTPSTDSEAITFLHNYCLYWFGRFNTIETDIGSVDEIIKLLEDKACPRTISG